MAVTVEYLWELAQAQAQAFLASEAKVADLQARLDALEAERRPHGDDQVTFGQLFHETVHAMAATEDKLKAAKAKLQAIENKAREPEGRP